MLRFLTMLSCLAVTAVSQAAAVVSWTDADTKLDGVLEVQTGELDGVTITAKDSVVGKGFVVRRGVTEVKGGSVVFGIPRGKGQDFGDEPMSAAIEKNQYVEFSFTVDGLEGDQYFDVTSFSWAGRPSANLKGGGVHGPQMAQLHVNGTVVGSEIQLGHKGIKAHSQNLAQPLRNGETFIARVYFAGIDAETKAADGVKGAADFHCSMQVGDVQVNGMIRTLEKKIEIPAVISYEEHVFPILKSRCIKCHGADKQKGDIRLDNLSTDFIKDRPAAETWHDASNLLKKGEMPPEDARELSREQRAILIAWIDKKLHDAVKAGAKFSDGMVMRRLNRDEYQYAMTDLLGFDMDYAGELPSDARSAEGFRNNGAALGMSSLQIENYFKSARRAMDLVLVEGEQPERSVTDVEPSKEAKGRRYKGGISERLGRANMWSGRFKGLPTSGPLTIRVTARSERKEGQPPALLQARYGYFAAGLTLNVAEDVGTVPITSTESAVYELTSRAEFFPQPEAHVPEEKQFAVVFLNNALKDGGPLPKEETVEIDDPSGKKDKKTGKVRKKKVKRVKEDPDFPKIIIEKVEFVRNDYKSWPPAEHRAIVPEGTDLASLEGVGGVLDGFLRRVWRRPPTSAESAKWAAHYMAVRKQSSSGIQALRETLAVALASTSFLYLSEPHSGDKSRPLNAHELAARLALFLWSSVPDAELSAVADSGELLNPDELKKQFRRMLRDEKTDRFARHFSSQWLDLEGVDRVAINPQVHKFNNDLKPYMVEETQAFFREILRNDLSAMQFIDADFTMANGELARYYNLNDLPRSQEFVRVKLDGKRPGGVLGHASVHMSGSDGADSHPIKRAVWIRERLLHDPPKPPPPDVPDVSETVKNFDKLSLREQLEVHRQKEACNDCHRSIDPWGIALERFSALGMPRTKTKRGGKAISTETVLPGGVPIDGVEALKKYLLSDRRDQFAHALTSKMLTYALGRSMALDDEVLVEDLNKHFADSDFKLSALMEAIVTSEAFMTR
jgi:hypothetical protein